MEIIYRQAQPSDAAQLLSYMKAIGGESDNLTFGADGIPFSVEQEAQFLEKLCNSSHSTILLALDGETIVGNGCIDGNGNPRFRHRRNLAISVRKAYWGNGIGSGLMERLIAFARGTGAEVISLEVRSDNDRAKALYRKFGFTSFGVFRKFFKLGEAYFDADYMNLYL